MQPPSSSNPRPEDKFMHKNRLQEHAQRSEIPLPLYQTINEGTPHAPQFRSSVTIDGVTFQTSQTFSQRKEAEQNVAKVALEGLSRKIEQQGCPLISSDATFCKSILEEYAVKMNLERPAYTCSQLEGLLPTFTSSVLFAGRVHKGSIGRNKKEAQQLAARAVVESILGDGDSQKRILMSQIIRSKVKLFATLSQIRQSSEAPPSPLEVGVQPKEEQVDPREPQEGPQTGQVILSCQIIPDDSHPRVLGPVKSESCFGLAHCTKVKPLTPSPLGPSSGAEGASSSCTRERSKERVGRLKVPRSKKYRTCEPFLVSWPRSTPINLRQTCHYV
ncbi:unnamed protein product [Spirodela intermedia]|uniref:DRBM domain-containing protein n=2 Tax=Spirodela intermedia TaxID=51605 RepID=A0A7I8JSF9_SPIIN|nr:unnamed protein product [Spirodela intermedia]CAA6673116.1 unnamed protein product [Spirodela intermedia]CAA7410332.1 unnamed protein product [Spirodela intermedia]